jgi:hypothetical protein
MTSNLVNLSPHYKNFLTQATPERRDAYYKYLLQAIGHEYPFSVMPYFLSEAALDKLTATTEALSHLLIDPSYQQSISSTPWVLPQRPMSLGDCFGAMDFFLTEQTCKLIEVNFTPPGFLAFNRLGEEALFENFDLDPAGQVNLDYEDSLVSAVCGKDPEMRLAIAVNHTSVSNYFRPHYRYLEKIFRRRGVHADIVLGNEVELKAGALPCWGGKSYDKVFNLVIPRLMVHQPEEYTNYIRIFHELPEGVISNPFGWRLGSKAFLCVCYHLDNKTGDLSEADRNLIRETALEAHPLNAFADPEDVINQFGGLEHLVIKPLDNYDTRGVYIQPSLDILSQVFFEERDDYIVQAFHAHTPHPFICADGTLKQHQVFFRVEFVAGKVHGVRARSFDKKANCCFSTPVVKT